MSEKLPGELNTVNVIVMGRGKMDKVRSFPDDENGNRLAEIAFHDEIVEWYKLQCMDCPLDEEIEAATEDGYFDYQGGSATPVLEIFLTHSS